MSVEQLKLIYAFAILFLEFKSTSLFESLFKIIVLNHFTRIVCIRISCRIRSQKNLICQTTLIVIKLLRGRVKSLNFLYISMDS